MRVLEHWTGFLKVYFKIEAGSLVECRLVGRGRSKSEAGTLRVTGIDLRVKRGEAERAMKSTFVVQLLSILVLMTGCSFDEPDPRTRQIRSACAAMGFRPNEAYFFTCVASLNMTAPMSSTELLANRGVAYVAPNDGGSDMHKRSERACYDVGLNPSQGPYWECVLDLDNSIADAAAVGSR
jgi:hypothetical protein